MTPAKASSAWLWGEGGSTIGRAKKKSVVPGFIRPQTRRFLFSGLCLLLCQGLHQLLADATLLVDDAPTLVTLLRHGPAVLFVIVDFDK